MFRMDSIYHKFRNNILKTDTGSTKTITRHLPKSIEYNLFFKKYQYNNSFDLVSQKI